MVNLNIRRQALIFLCLVWINVWAKDLGAYGQIFSIKEKDLLEVIKNKLNLMQENGDIMREQQRLLNKASNLLERPVGIALPPCLKTQSYNYDPRFYWPTDLKDHTGRVFYKAFTPVDPMNFIPKINRNWVLFDADDSKQVDWIKQQGVNFAKLILVKGSPIKLMKELKVPVYFDVNGRIAKKFGVKGVPAVIFLRNQKVTITEVDVRKS